MLLFKGKLVCAGGFPTFFEKKVAKKLPEIKDLGVGLSAYSYFAFFKKKAIEN